MNEYGAKQRNGGEKGSNRNAADPSVIGLPFHNPYTFIPFPGKAPERQYHLPLTIDEAETGLKSGILELEVSTVSPLLCCSPVPVDPDAEHKVYKALIIDRDVVMPATAIRGSLRTLLTIITGGTLGYVDEDLWLCQGRDTQLGPSSGRPGVPHNVFLAEVVEPGNSNYPGKIRLGKTQLVKLTALEKIDLQIDSKRPSAGKDISYYWIDDPLNPHVISPEATSICKWKLKMSGRKVISKTKMVKKKDGTSGLREGAILLDGRVLELPEIFWRCYQGRNRNAIRQELKKGDLIWLEPNDVNCTDISSVSDIKSIQWARWGRTGVSINTLLPESVKPDSLNSDGRVDRITQLFGQIPQDKEKKAAGPFAGRIRPHNLIFFDAKDKLIPQVTLAPLSSPHPGCLAFYRDSEDLDAITKRSPLKGYKVYRNTRERGENAPWHYTIQGLYGDQGELELPAQRKINNTVDLLREGVTGKLSIAFRALDNIDMALLLTACSLDWKLGGGKPLGLGHCRVTSIRVIDENGVDIDKFSRDPQSEEPLQLPKDTTSLVSSYAPRIRLYQESQKPVDKLRYPRAAKQNANKKNRGGHIWFSRHAAPKKTKSGDIEAGLQTLWTTGNLTLKAGGKIQIRAQTLRPLNPKAPEADQLYGYDGFETDTGKSNNNRMSIGDIELFDETKHRHATGRSGGNTSQNSATREAQRKLRGEQPATPPMPVTVSGRPHKAGDKIEAVLLEKKTKKGGWKAQSIAGNISGPIQNSGEITTDKKPGDIINVVIKSVCGDNSAFMYVN
jgi:hypothetical protein